MIVLFFGQPASGKTTLAQAFIKERVSCKYVHIDGDKWRDITKNKDYSKEGRLRNLKGAFDMAIYLEKEGFTPILSFVTPYQELRNYLLQNSASLYQIYLSYNLDRGRNMNFATDFEEPNQNCLHIDTSEMSIYDCVGKIKDYISK
jgi:adenylylsulfate kinase